MTGKMRAAHTRVGKKSARLPEAAQMSYIYGAALKNKDKNDEYGRNKNNKKMFYDLTQTDHTGIQETEMRAPKTYRKIMESRNISAAPVRMDAADQSGAYYLSDLLMHVDLPTDLCGEPAGADGSYYEVLLHCVSTLKKSPSAAMMLREAAQNDWMIELADLGSIDYCLDVSEKLLTLDHNGLSPAALERSGYFSNGLIVTISRALRDIWQEKRHGAFDELYNPERTILLERVRMADCYVLSTLVGWELRSEGHGEVWRHLIGSEDGDIAMSFSNHLEREPLAAFQKSALVSAFRQWFNSEDRLNICDHETLEYLDEILAETEEGSNPFGNTRPSRISVEILSCLPDKTAYLQGMGDEILCDPYYSCLQDPINQTHLFHIMYDLEVTMVNNVPFRDANLAAKIFPEQRKIVTIQE